jgi:phage replication-related protein YjqB (UPF0714/DUF867 family)
MLYQSASQSLGCLFTTAFGLIACTEKTLAMPDKYRSFSHLAAVESADSYKIQCVPRENAIAIIAPHAGKIEPGTSEICRAIASHDRSYYVFEGCKPTDNSELHITSTRFNEPQGISTAKSARVVVTIHGQAGTGEFINVGGLDLSLGQFLIERLQAEGYTASRHSKVALQGLDPANICNRGSSGRGIQLEISRGLRDRLVASCVEMDRFATVIRGAFAALKL